MAENIHVGKTNSVKYLQKATLLSL